jgi:hypothetical protein
MDPENEEKILARLYLNLKGPKKKQNNWMEIAQDCMQLSEYYGSAKKTADRLAVSYELVRSILKLSTLPEEVKALIRDNKILFDAGQRIARINNKNRQIEAAKAIAGLPAHTAREILQYAKKFPDAPLDDFRKRVVEGKDKIEKINLIIIPLGEDDYKFLKTKSQNERCSPEKLVQSILAEWIIENKKQVPE